MGYARGGEAGELLVLGESIRTCRERAGLRQEDLARIVGVGRLAISKWETGVRGPSTLDQCRIARACGVPVSHLIKPLDSFIFPLIRPKRTAGGRGVYVSADKLPRKGRPPGRKTAAKKKG